MTVSKVKEIFCSISFCRRKSLATEAKYEFTFTAPNSSRLLAKVSCLAVSPNPAALRNLEVWKNASTAPAVVVTP